MMFELAYTSRDTMVLEESERWYTCFLAKAHKGHHLWQSAQQGLQQIKMMKMMGPEKINMMRAQLQNPKMRC